MVESPRSLTLNEGCPLRGSLIMCFITLARVEKGSGSTTVRPCITLRFDLLGHLTQNVSGVQGRNLHCRWLTVRVLSHHLCSWCLFTVDMYHVFQIICLLSPKPEHQNPRMSDLYSLSADVQLSHAILNILLCHTSHHPLCPCFFSFPLILRTQ